MFDLWNFFRFNFNLFSFYTKHYLAYNVESWIGTNFTPFRQTTKQDILLHIWNSTVIWERIFSHRIRQKLCYARHKNGLKIKVTNSLKCSGSEHKKPDWQREKRYVFILFRQKEGSVHFFRRVKNVPTEWTLMRQHYWLMCWHTVFPF